MSTFLPVSYILQTSEDMEKTNETGNMALKLHGLASSLPRDQAIICVWTYLRGERAVTQNRQVAQQNRNQSFLVPYQLFLVPRLL